MKKKSVKKNYIYNVLYQVLVMIIPLITTPYLSRTLGAEKIGIYSYTISIITYFILFGSLGIAMYGQREIAYVQDNRKKRSKTFYEITLLRVITLTVSIAIFFPIFCIHGEYNVYYRILLLEIFATMLDISWFFQGIEEFKKTITRNLIIKLISVVLIFIFVNNPNDLIKYFMIFVLSTLIGNLSLWFYLPKTIEKVSIKELEIKHHLKPTIALFIPQIAIQLYTVLDKTMLGTMILDKSEVGYYEQAQKIVKLLLTLITALGTVMMPRIASTYAKGDNQRLRQYMEKSFAFVIMLALPLTLGIISVSNNFVPFFYGPGYEKVAPLIRIISPIIVIIGISNIIGVQYLLPTKQQTKYTISVIIGAIVNFILNIVFINLWKSIGASIATLIAELTVTITQIILIHKEIEFKKIPKLIYKYIIAVIIMFIINMLIKQFINNNVISILVQVITSSFIYFSILIIMKDEMLYSYIKKNEKIKNLIEKTVYVSYTVISLAMYSFILFTYIPISEKKRILIIIVNIIVFLILFLKSKHKEKIIKIFSIIIFIITLSLNLIIGINIKKTTNYGFVKYTKKPVFGNIITRSVFDPNVIIDKDGIYRMYFSYRKENSIGITTSKDGIHWTNPTIALFNNLEQKWEQKVNRATVLSINDKYYMWYTGQDKENSNIGIAISNDGYNFERVREQPIITPKYEYEGKSVMNPYVLYDEEEKIFKMWYAAGETYEPDVIAYATSKDGIEWNKYEQNPILRKSKEKSALDNYKVGACEVYKLGKNEYIMFYIGYSDIDTARIFYATSKDGIEWNKSKKPIISGTIMGFDHDAVYKPTAIYNKEKNEWMLWYNGRLIDREYVGLAICKDCRLD